MIDILFRFWFRPIAVTADIEKAFHQINLKKQERDYLHFLWIDQKCSQNDELKLITSWFRRVLFGIIASSFILAAVITFLLKQNPQSTQKIS